MNEAEIRDRGWTWGLIVVGILIVLILIAVNYLSRFLGEELAASLGLIVGVFAIAAMNPVRDFYVNWMLKGAGAKIDETQDGS